MNKDYTLDEITNYIKNDKEIQEIFKAYSDLQLSFIRRGTPFIR